MKLSLIIVHYRTPGPLKNCLESVFAQNFQDFEVIVVDNEPNPELPSITAPFSRRVKLIQNQQNLGFGRANNLGASVATGEVLLLLNPDTYLNDRDTLQKLLDFQSEHPEYGVIGPKIKDQHDHALAPRTSYPGLKHDRSALFQNLPGDIAWILGAAMLIPAKVFQEVKGFDPDYFLYGEEADLCLRIRKAGFAIGYNPHISLEHIGGASEKTTREYDYWLKKQRGLYLFYTKHYPPKLWRALLKQELRRARFRLFTLWFERCFRNNPHMTNKVDRNSAIRDAILKTLRDTQWLKMV